MVSLACLQSFLSLPLPLLSKKYFKFVYFERELVPEGEEQRERKQENQKQAPCTASAEPTVRLDLTNREIMT